MTSPPLDDPVARVREELESGRFHPLEIIPFFRRFPCGMWRDLLYTFIWNCGFGLAFFGLDVAFGGGRASFAKFYAYLIVSNVIGYMIHLNYSIGGALGIERWARRSHFIVKVFYYAAVPTLSVIAGFWLVSTFMDIGIRGWNASPTAVFSILVSSIVISLVLSVVFFTRERSAMADAMIERERAKSERIEREAALANLRALQAQIEPHFLFNTLANVTGLIDPDPAKAKRMLESFIRFLRASLAATRAESTTLGAESELIGAFLDVLAIRMGPRLRYTVEIEPGLTGFTLPPMLVQPVVENAIKHGLEPKVDGGSVAVRARRDGAHVAIEIADTGMGFAPVTSGGVGLTNLRDRLRLLYGERAALDIRENSPSGTTVTLRLPA